MIRLIHSLGLTSLIALLFGADTLRGDDDFWSYRPLSAVAVPPVQNGSWPGGDIDRFILARLEQARLLPVSDADHTTLARRIYFDIIGVPPTTDQVDEFVNDPSQQRVAKLIDRLLDSPQFGERWGRHWLDVARYADSSGGGRSLLFPNAWRYRDYVIDSFRRDKPFSLFIREQVAGDLLPFQSDDERAEKLIATSFLMIGAHNYELQDKEQLRMDVVDEQIETVGRALLGQTLGCARCHDHKFDPVPTADYYALAGIFRSTKSLTPGNVSGFEQHELPVSAERRAEIDSHTAAVQAAQDRLNTAKAELKSLQANGRDSAASGPAAVNPPLLGIVVDDSQAKVTGMWTKSKYNSGYIGEGYIHDGANGKGEKTVVFPADLPHAGLYEVRVSYTHGSNRSPSVPVTVHFDGDQETVQIDQRQLPPIGRRFIALGRWRFARGSSDAVVFSNEATTGHVIVDAVQFIPIELLESNVPAVPGPNSAKRPSGTSNPSRAQSAVADSDASARAAAIKEIEAQVKRFEGDLKKLKERAPQPAPLTMGVKDEQEPSDFRVCVRGIVHNLGEPVRRGFLTAVSPNGTAVAAIADGRSGRLELADWLANPSNPLTARVAVNRIWHHLFGAGLVRTTDNFGTTGEAPSHPELLDWLALRFIELGWSNKRMIREIVLSRSYQMASRFDRPAGSAVAESPASEGGDPGTVQVTGVSVDPSNRLLWHQNRKRLDAECLHDAMLSVSGRLDLNGGGPSIRDKTDSEYGYRFDSVRRAIYSPVFRNNLPDILDVFDFADPNTPTGRRNVSTLPSQALFLLNSPFVMNVARHAAEQILELDLSDSERIAIAYRRAIGRAPNDAELQAARAFLDRFRSPTISDPVSLRREAWTQLWQVLIASVEFRYVE